MHRLSLAVVIGSMCVMVTAGTTDVPKKVGAEELMQMVTAAQGASDGEMAQKLREVVLTDRLSDARVSELMKKAPGEKSRTELILLRDQSMFLAAPADEVAQQAAPDAAATRQMLVKIVNYVNTTVRQLPNLMATRFTNGYEDRPAEDRLTSTGIESLSSLPLHWVGSVKMEVTYRDRQEVEDKGAKTEKKGAGFGGLTTRGEFGPFLSTVMADALKGKITWTRWEKGSDATLAVFHYEVPEAKSDYHVQFCCVVEGYDSNNQPEMKVYNERSAYHGDIVFNPADGSIRLLTLEADLPAGGLVSGAGIAVEYAPEEIGGRSYLCPVRSVSTLWAHTAQQTGAQSRSNYKGGAKLFLNDVVFSDYRRFGSETKILTDSPGY